MVRAWRFADKPDLVKVLGRQLPRAAISGAVLLNESEQPKCSRNRTSSLICLLLMS
jgi:hypothetical protein